MNTKEMNVVTGAYGFTGKYTTRLLLEKGSQVRTLTNHPKRPNPFGCLVEAMPYNFDNPKAIVENLKGVTTVYNTYWVRFNYGCTTYGQAVSNVQNLIRAAAEAGVKRFVHISIANPDEHSSSGYFRGKAIMERTLIESGLSYAIIRPTVLFGREDVLFNNIAWLLRRFPVFAIAGRGEYRIQPVFVEDVAKLAVGLAEENGNIISDAVGPETYSFEEIVYMIRQAVKSRARIIHLHPDITHLLTTIINPLIGDILITRDEIRELMRDRLVSCGQPTCKTRFSEWLKEHAENIGKEYASELKRHFK